VEFQSSEIADLMMMLVLGPIILVIVRRTAPSMLAIVALCIGFVATGYVATVLEGVLLPVFFNLVEHASFAFAGLGFVWLLVLAGKRLAGPNAGAR